MTKLAIKLFGYNNAKTILNRPYNGKSWYMAYDICRLLGIENYSAAVNKPFKSKAYTLLPSEYQYKTEFTGAANRRVLMVSESGVLKLIMQSDPAFNAEIQGRALAILKPL